MVEVCLYEHSLHYDITAAAAFALQVETSQTYLYLSSLWRFCVHLGYARGSETDMSIEIDKFGSQGFLRFLATVILELLAII